MTDNTAAFRAARDALVDLATDYSAAVETFRWPAITGRFSWATDWFDEFARDNQRTGLWIVEEDGSEQKHTFADLVDRSDRIAKWLQHQGVRKGDRVLLMLGNQVELWESMLAVAKLGAVIMPTTAALGPADLTDRVSRGQVDLVVANATDTDKFADVPGDYSRVVVGSAVNGWLPFDDAYDVAPEPFEACTDVSDPLLVYFTSGTTNKPKMVQHSQISYPVGHLGTMYWIGARPDDVHLAISSPGWAKHAWSLFFAPWNAEAAVFIYNYTRFDAAALVAQIRRAGVNTFCAPPTVWRILIQTDLGARPEGLREVLAAGEPLNPEVITRVEQTWGLTVRDGFGQTETTLQVGNTPGQLVKPGSMGRPVPGVPVVLVDPLTDQPAQEGEICLDVSRDPVNLMTGYLDDPELNAAAMAGGYYHTGDIASRDEDGYLTYIGRSDDVFKSADYKVSPFELESVLIEHPAVVEAAVVPQPDSIRLAVPKAYVVLAAGWEADRATALSILQHAKEHLAPYLRVRRLEFSELPKTVSGKIRRAELRERENPATRRSAPTQAEYRYEDFPELRR